MTNCCHGLEHLSLTENQVGDEDDSELEHFTRGPSSGRTTKRFVFITSPSSGPGLFRPLANPIPWQAGRGGNQEKNLGTFL